MSELSIRATATREQVTSGFRKSTQAVMPSRLSDNHFNGQGSDIYPFHPLGNGKIKNGYTSLAAWMSAHPAVIIEGFSGVLWEEVQHSLEEAFAK